MREYVSFLMLISLVVLYIVDVNFPLHRYNLWRRLIRKALKRKPKHIIKNNPYLRGKPTITTDFKKADGLVSYVDYTDKIVIVSDNIGRINNFITNVLKDDSHSFKYLKVNCASKLAILLQNRVKCYHLIYGYDNLSGIETVLNHIMDSGQTCNFYGDQLYMDI